MGGLEGFGLAERIHTEIHNLLRLLIDGVKLVISVHLDCNLLGFL